MVEAVESRPCRARFPKAIPRESSRFDASKWRRLRDCAWMRGATPFAVPDQRLKERLERFHLAYATHREDACTSKIFGSSQKSSVSLGWTTTGLLLENGSENDRVAGGDPFRCRGHGRGKPLPASCSGRTLRARRLNLSLNGIATFEVA